MAWRPISVGSVPKVMTTTWFTPHGITTASCLRFASALLVGDIQLGLVAALALGVQEGLRAYACSLKEEARLAVRTRGIRQELCVFEGCNGRTQAAAGRYARVRTSVAWHYGLKNSTLRSRL